MRKFLAVLKREYIQRVRAKMFIVTTILLPVVMSLFGLVPAVILSIDAGSPMRVAVLDQTGKMYGPLRQAVASDDTDQDTPATPQNANNGRTPARPGLGNFIFEQVY